MCHELGALKRVIQTYLNELIKFKSHFLKNLTSLCAFEVVLRKTLQIIVASYTHREEATN